MNVLKPYLGGMNVFMEIILYCACTGGTILGLRRELGETWQSSRVFSDNMMAIVCLDLTKCYSLC